MKTILTATLTALFSLSASAAEFWLTALNCDSAEGNTTFATAIGNYEGQLSLKPGQEKINYVNVNRDLSITGSVVTFENGKRMIIAKAQRGSKQTAKIEVFMPDDRELMMSSNYCNSEDDVGSLVLRLVSFE